MGLKPGATFYCLAMARSLVTFSRFAAKVSQAEQLGRYVRQAEQRRRRALRHLTLPAVYISSFFTSLLKDVADSLLLQDTE